MPRGSASKKNRPDTCRSEHARSYSGMAKEFTAVNVKENLDCSYNTASAALNGLVALNLFEKRKMGREWVYFLRPAV